VSEGGKRVGLKPKGESPKKMGVVVHNDQVVFVAGEAKDRRRPEITMDKIKGLNNPGRGSGKDVSDGRADKHDRGAQKSPGYRICLSGWKART
jgi:hypothetical protein